ncbi:MAG: hypothetical protein KAS18_11150, partial [Calditrichia bacterium]|nr:hypothetical protein [Calditrichia bacterium]
VSINVNNSLLSVGDTLEVEINTPFTSGEIYVELTNENNEPLIENFNAIQSSNNNFSFVIPDELNEQVGFIKAFATNSTQSSHGVAKIAVKKSLLDSVTVSPQNPKVNQPIDLFVHIHSEILIQTVTIRNLYHANMKQQDVVLIKLNDSLYTTSTSLGPYNEEGTWYFTVEIVDTTGNIAEYHQQKFTISDPRPDLDIIENSFKFTGNIDVQLSVQIKNNYSDNIPSVKIGFFENEYKSNSIPFHFVNESFTANEKKIITFSVDNSLLSIGKKFIAVVDYDSLLDERDESNNVDSSLVYESFVLVSANNGTVDTLNIQNIAKVYIEPNALNQSSTMNFSIKHDSERLELDSQPGFKYISFGTSHDSMIVNLKLNNPAAQLILPAFVAFKMDTSMSIDSLNHIGIYRFSSHLNQWIKVSNDSMYGDYKYVKTNTLGEFALFYVNDNESPVIEITVNGKALRNNMLVPATPELAIILQDENGIDISKGIFIKIDGDTIPRSEMNVPDSVQNSNAISILTSPRFQTGEHTLIVEAIDANGNKTIKSLNITTTDKFDVKVYGNYPNPFSEETYISYKLYHRSDFLREFWIKIYTVSGRMIRKLETIDMNIVIDYGEFYWDGRDDDGIPVANGVYFAIIYAKDQDGKEVEKRIKMAKLK